MDKLPKVAMPLIILIILLIVFVSKSTLTIGSGKAGVLYKTFENGVVTDQPPLGEGFHIIAPWNKVFIYEVRQQEVFEKMQVLSSNGLEIKLDASAWFEPKYEFLGKLHQGLGGPFAAQLHAEFYYYILGKCRFMHKLGFFCLLCIVAFQHERKRVYFLLDNYQSHGAPGGFLVATLLIDDAGVHRG